MKRSSSVAASVLSLMGTLLAASLSAQEPAKRAEAAKPPWQRFLQGEDAKKAADYEKKMTELEDAGRYAEALKVTQELIELRTKRQGADHWQTISIRFHAEALRRGLKTKPEERKNFTRAYELQAQAEPLKDKGRYAEALPLLEQSRTLMREILGEDHPDTAQSYSNVAVILDELGRHREAEKEHRKALALFRKVLGDEHPDTANGYNNLAANLGDQGKYREAVEVHRQALAIRLNAVGEENLDTAESYNNIAINLEAQGKYKEAEPGLRAALAICRKLQGDEHPFTIKGYNNLALNLDYQGKYREAEEGLRKALALFRKALGEEHPDTALGYNNLAANLDTQGKYHEAEEGHRQALAIRRKVLGEEHRYTAQSYGNLALHLQLQGKYQEAEEDYRRALAICRTALGEEHPDTALDYRNLANCLNKQGKYSEAEEDYRKALALCRKVLGEEHPSTALSYHNLAGNLHAQGKYREAEANLRTALAIHRKALGEEHPDTAFNYNNLGQALSAQGKYQDAETIFDRAAESFDKARLHVAATGLERAAFTSKNSPLPTLAAVLARNGKPEDAWQRFEESLSRGTWDDFTARLRWPAAERDKQTQLTVRINRLNKLIEKVSVAKPTPEQTKQRAELLGQLRQAYDEVAAFAQQLEKKYGPIAGQVSRRAQIQQVLPAEAALIGWLDIAGQPNAADPNGEHWAILLRSSGAPVWVRLPGSGAKNTWTDADTQLPAELRAALQSTTSKWQPLAERLRRQRLQPLEEHLQGVRQLIVLPSTALAGVPIEAIADGYTVSYAHSGTMYAHLRQQAAPTSKGLFALADPIFESRDLAEKPQPLPPGGVLLTMVAPGSNAAKAGLKPNDVLLRYGDTVLAGPADFKPLPEAPDSAKDVPVIVWRDGETRKQPLYVRPGKLDVVIANEPAPQALAEQRRLDRLVVSRSGEDDKWKRLPGTRLEVAALQRLFDREPSRVLLDSQASEQRLNELAGSGALGKYRYVHLATHGEVNDTFPLRSAVILARDHLPNDQQRTELLLSGQPIPDGRLSAEEVLRGWNLSADLVTLSACQTALGKYERGEGYVGFAQALVLSGSRSVCLSLWKVDDTATALLMERFYQNLLGKREGLKAPLSKSAALAEAKAWLRELPRAEAVKRAASLSNGVDRGKGADLPSGKETPAPVPGKDARPYSHPYYWAAFVLVGHAD